MSRPLSAEEYRQAIINSLASENIRKILHLEAFKEAAFFETNEGIEALQQGPYKTHRNEIGVIKTLSREKACCPE